MIILKKLHSKFNLYLLKELFIILMLSMGVLTFVLILNRLGKMADLVVNKGVGLKDIFLLILYSAPPYLTLTLPMAFLLSVIVVLGRLSTENEVLVLKASGVNLKRLFIPVAILALFITFCGLFNANYLMPKSSLLFRSTLFNVAKKSVSMDDKEGIFNDTIRGIVIYINKVNPQSKTLSGVFISDDRDINVKQIVSARTGYININPDTLELYFTLENGNFQRWEKTSDTYRNVNFNNYTFSMNLAMMIPNLGELRRPAYELTPHELNYYLTHMKTDKERYETMLDIYKIKVAIPLSPLAFIFLTVPLGVKRRVEGKFSGILYSLMIFVFYYVLLALTENLGKAINLHALATTLLSNVIIAALGCYLIRNLNEEEYTTITDKIRSIWVYCLEKTK